MPEKRQQQPFTMDKAKVIEEVEDTLAQIIPIITGKKSNYKLNKKQKAKLKQTLDLQEKNYNLDYNSMDINEQKKRLREFLLDYSETVFGVRKDPFEITEEKYSKLYDDPKIDHFLYNTKFTSYRSAVFRIIEKIDNDHLFSKVGEFSNNLDNEEFLGMFQHMRRINTKDFEYLNKNHSNITKAVVDRYISIYDNLSGNLEKFVRYLVWISRIFEGKPPNYSSIRKDSLANHIGYLRMRQIFKDLVEPFNVTIRNAAAHKSSVLVDPVHESITFIDTKYTVKRSYHEFIKETRELAAAWKMISSIGFAANLIAIQKIKKLLYPSQ